MSISKDKRVEYNREYYKEKKDEILEQKRDYRKLTRISVLQALGGKCEVCKIDDLRVLTVVGSIRGKEEGYTTYYNRLFDGIRRKTLNLTLLCENCKLIKEN